MVQTYVTYVNSGNAGVAPEIRVGVFIQPGLVADVGMAQFAFLLSKKHEATLVADGVHFDVYWLH